MEGPTPVSALIHAATMVTAGVYLIARMHPLFEQSVAAADVGTIIGALTLFVAATIGMVVTDLKRVIAYSTMSQIGYMVMAVSSGAYVAGMFHLMTHAFFKALLFMSAGSLISAMGGDQNLDRMRGFRKAMPFTFLCFVVGGLALAGVPPFSGFFSKDEILLVQGEIGGWHWILYVVGYITALMTAIYTWRMIFRAFWGEPVEQARELEHGHLWHAPQPTNPANGEVEDTDVGFPGPEHHIAERALPMKIAMGSLAVLATIGGVVLIPKVTTWFDTFLEPTFADSTIHHAAPSNGLLWGGLALGAALGVLGIYIAYRIWGKANGEVAVRAPRARPRAAQVLRQQVVLRRADRLGGRPPVRLVRALRPADLRAHLRQRHADRRPVDAGPRRLGRRARRAVRLPARLRGAAARRRRRRDPVLPDPVLVSLPLSIPLWLPAAAAFLALLLPGVATRALVILGALGTFAWSIWAIIDFDRSARGLQNVTDEIWVKQLGIHYKLGIDGLNLFLIALAAFIFLVCLVWAAFREWEHPKQFFLFFAVAESAVLGALMAQDLALFVLFFDLMLLPFLFLTGIWGPESTRVAAITKLFIYTLVGSLLMLAAAIATGVLVSQQSGNDLSFAFSDLAKVTLPKRLAELDLPLLRRRVLGQDAGLPGPRLDARRLPQHAAAGARRLLGRAVQGRRLRLPARRDPALPGRVGALPGPDAGAGAGLDPLRLGDGVHDV